MIIGTDVNLAVDIEGADLSEAQAWRVSVKQGSLYLVYGDGTATVTDSGSTVTVLMPASDSAQLSSDSEAVVQVNWIDADGLRHATSQAGFTPQDNQDMEAL